MQYKLLVLDIDGTLLNSRGIVSAVDRQAIADAVRAGVKVAVSTGRAALAASWVLDDLGLDGYHIFFDGALVSNPYAGHEAYAATIAPDLVRQAIEIARGSDLHFDVYSSTRYFVEKETWAVEIRRSFFRIEPTVADFSGIERRERIIKGTLIVRTDEEKARARELERALRGKLVFSWTMTPAYPGIDFINVISPAASKGRALDELCGVLDIPLSAVMAIGDGVNDVSLLKKAGLAVAMGNGGREIKSVAHMVTGDVDHGGVAEAVRRFLL